MSNKDVRVHSDIFKQLLLLSSFTKRFAFKYECSERLGSDASFMGSTCKTAWKKSPPFIPSSSDRHASIDADIVLLSLFRWLNLPFK